MGYLAYTVCHRHDFILDFNLTLANVNDSIAFDSIYHKVTKRFPKIKTVTMDAGYKTSWICKKVIDDGRNVSLPYKRPMSQKDFFKPYEFVYDEYY